MSTDANIYDLQNIECRAGLKPMQPMQLHWALRLWGRRTMVFG